MDNPLKSIEEEAADCRAAFVGAAVGTPVWCCHHERLYEVLEEPAENRIAYILSDKPSFERARRLREFRPVKDTAIYRKVDALVADYKAKRAPLDADYKAKRALLDADYEAKRAPLVADYEAKLAPLYADYEAKRALL